MSPASYGLALVFLISGCALGWFANRSYVSHGDVKSTKAKIPGYRKSRHQNGIIAVILAVVIFVVVFDVIHPHK
jgi:hypothetical protein